MALSTTVPVLVFVNGSRVYSGTWDRSGAPFTYTLGDWSYVKALVQGDINAYRSGYVSFTQSANAEYSSVEFVIRANQSPAVMYWAQLAGGSASDNPPSGTYPDYTTSLFRRSPSGSVPTYEYDDIYDGDWVYLEVTQIEVYLKTCTLTYNANGGQDAPPARAFAPNTTFNLSSATPTKDGSQFKGWATTSSGAVAYSPGQSVTFSDDRTIYAVWRAYTNELVNSSNLSSPVELVYDPATGNLVADY